MSNNLSSRPSKFGRALSALAVLLLVTSCAATGGVPDVTTSKQDTFCKTAHPIVLNDAAIAALDDEAAKKALAHNRYGAKHCGWKPEKRAD